VDSYEENDTQGGRGLAIHAERHISVFLPGGKEAIIILKGGEGSCSKSVDTYLSCI